MAMKVSTEEAGTLLNKYISELTPLLATLETEDARACVSGILSAGSVGGVPHLFVGNVEDDFADSMQFRFVLEDCEFAYGDLRDATQEPVENLTNRVESFFCITAKKSRIRMGLIELKNAPAR